MDNDLRRLARIPVDVEHTDSDEGIPVWKNLRTGDFQTELRPRVWPDKRIRTETIDRTSGGWTGRHAEAAGRVVEDAGQPQRWAEIRGKDSWHATFVAQRSGPFGEILREENLQVRLNLGALGIESGQVLANRCARWTGLRLDHQPEAQSTGSLINRHHASGDRLRLLPTGRGNAEECQSGTGRHDRPSLAENQRPEGGKISCANATVPVGVGTAAAEYRPALNVRDSGRVSIHQLGLQMVQIASAHHSIAVGVARKGVQRHDRPGQQAAGNHRPQQYSR